MAPNRTLLLLLLTSALLVTSVLAWCPAGTWQDQNGRCHSNSNPPQGWRPINNDNNDNNNNRGSSNNRDSVNWQSQPGYNRYNNPGQFFNGQGNGWLNPFRGMSRIPFINVDWNMAKHIRIVHGVMAGLAFIVFFPFGAIFAAAFSGAIGVGLHVAFQMLGFLFYLIAFAMGLWMATNIRWRGFDLYQNYHPILGILIFLVIFFQPISGALHYVGFQKHGRRGFASYLHAWMGRIFIILGMINGGLGLYISGNASGGQIMAYALLAAMIFIVWMIAAAVGAVKRHRKDVPRRSTPPRSRGSI